MNLYEESAAINHIKSLNFTRYAATEGESKAINYIRKQLDKDNIEVKVESFEWSKSFSNLRKLIFLWIFIFILGSEILLLFLDFTWLIIPLDCLFFLVLILVSKYFFDYSGSIFFGKKRESKNIITTIQAKNLYPKRPVIIFSAHYDSVSNNVPYKMLKRLLLSGLFLLFSHIIINLVLSIWSIIILLSIIQIEIFYFWMKLISLIIGIILLIEIVTLFFMKVVSISLGAIDNASGVAILIELAKLIKKYPLEKIDVIFLWCGAGKVGLCGSKNYCSKHFEELDYIYNLNKSYNINIDMVGTYVGLIDETGLIKKKKLNKNLNDVLKLSDAQHKIPSEKTNMSFGSGSDHSVFQAFTKKFDKRGFQVACFSSEKDLKFIHSKKDILELSSAENLNGCIDVCYNAIRSLDSRVE
ncbi:MAG: M28 family metallopeptidase [Candidatus Odinarchaeota archaeon]